MYFYSCGIIIDPSDFQNVRKAISRDELKACANALEKAHNLCSENKGSSELVADVGTLFQCLK